MGVHCRLQNKVIDLEVSAHTPSPTVDPSVRVVLIGHSMGGIVAAETLLSIARDTPIQPCTSSTPPANATDPATSASTSTTNLNLPTDTPQIRSSSAPADLSLTNPTSDSDKGAPSPSPETPSLLFPYIQAVLAFDTPYLGIHPGVVAHGAEQQYNTASAAYNAYTQATKLFGMGSNQSAAIPSSSTAGALPAPQPNASGWGKWGKYAMYAGSTAAVAAAAGGVWASREQISSGWTWVGSHLEFVGCLARGAELTQRIEAVVKLGETHGIGFADFYTALGTAQIGKTKYSAGVLGERRTFCVIPKKAAAGSDESKIAAKLAGRETPSPGKRRKVSSEQDDEQKHSVNAKTEGASGGQGVWIRCTNEKATSEAAAHTGMFAPRENPDYFAMGERARECIVYWVDKSWYEASVEEAGEKGQEEKQEALDSQAGAEWAEQKKKQQADPAGVEKEAEVAGAANAHAET